MKNTATLSNPHKFSAQIFRYFVNTSKRIMLIKRRLETAAGMENGNDIRSSRVIVGLFYHSV
jgi:hypothetical protein